MMISTFSNRVNTVASRIMPSWIKMVFGGAVLTAGGFAAEVPTADQLKFFENEVRPLLAGNCYTCHAEEKQKGGLRLDHISWIKKGGDSEVSALELMMEVVRREDEDFAMPPKAEDALSEQQIGVLEKWIAMGAPWPEESGVAKAAETDEHGFTKEDYQWWAVQGVIDPAVPELKPGAWEKSGNPIDAFVFRKLTDAKLEPAPKASREELVRRAYFDLHGLPPTPEQLTAFVNDERPGAWARLIDELLASPRYGERWASHWLDVVRYAESDGYRADGYRPAVYRYRDYVIDSLNADKPYDQFVREQLAADEFAADDPEKLIATAFLRLGIYEHNQRNARMHWDLIMTEMTNVTAEAFLGIGIGCAQCHDHKFDPILQKDHFAMRSFLNTAWWPEDRMLGAREAMQTYEKEMAEWEKATADIRKQIDEMEAPLYASKTKSIVKQFPADIQEMVAKPVEERTPFEEQMAQLVQRQVVDQAERVDAKKSFQKDPEKLKRYEALLAELAKFEKPEPLPEAFITTDISLNPAETLMEKRDGEVKVEPAFLTLLGQPAPKITPTKNTTGRRLALANWIADENNPLSTRVIVNRVWQRHFGQGIVPTPNDFGRLGETPSHPELLDWLTKRFLEKGWKLKPLHRLIMSSEAYQQTARREPTTDEDVVDPENRLLWRFPPQRLQAEQVRDAMLAVSGEMKHRDKGGPSVSGASPNRSVYLQKKRNSPDEMIGGFDAPSGFASMPERIATTTPTQSLMLVNGEWSMTRARAFARRILAGKELPDADSIQQAFQIAYGREATEAEISAALGFVNSQSASVSAAKPEAHADKYPGESGFRPIKQKFGFPGHEKYALGEQSLWLQPDSKFARLEFSEIDLPTEEFTIEAVVDLDSIHADASVNTLAARWNGSKAVRGWTFGVTSEKSAYQPRNFIMQLIGDDFQGNTIYEVVASDLRFPTGKPVYIAASVSAKAKKDDPTKGTVTFFMKDLSDAKSELQRVEVDHSIVGGLEPQQFVKSLIGSREGPGHTWDGQLARFAISHGVLDERFLLVNGGVGGTEEDFRRVLDLDFSGLPKHAKWIGPHDKPEAKKGESPALTALSDFCHALLTSNEFLYLH